MTGPRFPHLPDEAWAAFLRDDLDDAAVDRIERHLIDCPACREILEAEDPVFLFRRLRDQPAPAGTWDGFWEALAPRLESRPRRRSRFVADFARVAAVIVAGSILVLFATRIPPIGGDTADLAVDAASGPSAGDPCPASVASLRLTRDECLALFGAPIEPAEPPQFVISESMDLRGL